MADYAQIIDGVVNRIVIDNLGDLNALLAKGLEIQDVTEEDPKPSTGWTYNGSNYSAPVYEWAKIVSDAVDSIVEYNDVDAQAAITGGDTLVNIDQMIPKPEVGWGYADGVFTAP